MHEQRSEEWYAARLAHVTASRFKDVCTGHGRPSKSATAENYLYELIGEYLCGRPEMVYETIAMRHGINHEPIARDLYEATRGLPVDETGFHPLPGRRIGGSPDGLIGEEGLIEIKCPYTVREHVRTLLTNKIPEQYRSQVNGLLWVTGRQWCDYVSYSAWIEDPGMSMIIIRHDRDDDAIAKLASAVEAFEQRLCDAIRKLK